MTKLWVRAIFLHHFNPPPLFTNTPLPFVSTTGNDSVTDCALLSDGRPQILHSINIGKANEELSDNEFHGVTVVNTTYSNGILYCKWRKRRRFTLRGTRFDLKDYRYYIMLAYGRLTSLSSFRRKEPHMDKVLSESQVDFRLIGFISAHSKMFLVKMHGMQLLNDFEFSLSQTLHLNLSIIYGGCLAWFCQHWHHVGKIL